MKKRFALAVIVTAAMALSLVGCGVKVTLFVKAFARRNVEKNR